MKKLIVLSLSLFLLHCNSSESSNDNFQGENLADNYPTYEQTAETKNDLLCMWEEEKLARDVYIYSYNLWGKQTFSNISSSEQQHMNAIYALIEKYNIETQTDPSIPGQYSIPELQNLYLNLTQRSQISLTEALKVGQEIELLDINDLKTRIQTATPDISAVYSKLLEGSYRHLNAFNKNL